MYIKKVQILIEQGLQSIGVFAYSDFQKEEVDLQINKKLLKMLQDSLVPVINAQNQKIKKLKLQIVLDSFQNLEKRLTITPDKGEDYYSLPLPSDYVHLTSDVSQILADCIPTSIKTGEIISGQYYIVKGKKSVVYNTVTYTTGSIFQGVDDITGFTFSGTGDLLINKLRTQLKPNRLTEEHLLYETLNNSLEKTSVNSPVSVLSGDTLYIYVDGFYINKVYLTYLRKPRTANYAFTTYDQNTDLIVGKTYESIKDSIIYNSVTYPPFTPFVVVSGQLRYTGTGTKVREFQDGDVELSDSMSYVLIDAVVKELAILSEQSQQKIVNLS